MRLLIASALALPLTVVATGCEDPAASKPAAKVAPAKSAAPKMDAASIKEAVADAAASASAKKFAFSGADSKVGFVGSKVTGSHSGGFKTLKGTAGVDNGRVVYVNVEIDMNSTFSDSEKLTGHLKSPDFFNVAKHAATTFSSTKIETGPDGKATVTGNLMLNGVKKSITFPAMIKVSPTMVNVDAEFSLNRKSFGIVYAGKADNLIRDGVVLKLDIDAKAQ